MALHGSTHKLARDNFEGAHPGSPAGRVDSQSQGNRRDHRNLSLAKSTYTVELLGFTETERKALASAFDLSAGREPAFARHDSPDTVPDILLVDADDAHAVAMMGERQASNRVPAVMVGHSSAGTHYPLLPKPIRWIKLFASLENAASYPQAGSRVHSASTGAGRPVDVPRRPVDRKGDARPAYPASPDLRQSHGVGMKRPALVMPKSASGNDGNTGSAAMASPPEAPVAPQPSVEGTKRRNQGKFLIVLAIAASWALLSLYLAQRWISDLSGMIGPLLANLVIYGIAIIPGFMNAFLIAALLIDRRPARARVEQYPGLTILVAAYNEEGSIESTLKSIELQDYPGPLQVIVINDGSTDNTQNILAGLHYPWLTVINLEKNAGKANALNQGLLHSVHDLTITLDADSYLYAYALRNLVGSFLSDPDNLAAVAGAVLVRNSRLNIVTKLQEWDYFHGIAAVKRVQSMFQGTLVAQGAYSIYRTDVLREVGGWKECVGEDIVLTWAILEHGYRVGYCEDACSFTNAPTTFHQFIRQRQRWSRGLIEAFKHHWRLLFHWRMSTVFIWWNLLFPFLDFIYIVAFLPGVALALFGYYWLAGPLTLLVLPLAMLINYFMFLIQSRMFTSQGLKVRTNPLGFVLYALFYGIILQPACFIGYLSEITGNRKTWGTK